MFIPNMRKAGTLERHRLFSQTEKGLSMPATKIYIPDVTTIPFGPDYPYSTLNTISNGIGTFTTASGDSFIVDAEDCKYVSAFTWYAVQVSPGKRYVQRNLSQKGGVAPKTAYLHRELLSLNVGTLTIDHANGDGLDNTRANLRIATHSQNSANKTKSKSKDSSRYKGVYQKGRKWISEVSARGHKVYLGTFKTEDDAARAYNAGARRMFGDFAKLNVVPS